MMTKDKATSNAALKLALEIALEKEYQLRKTGQSHMIEPVITAIKEALAQGEQSSSQEPVAYYHPQLGFYWTKPTKITAPTIVDVEPLSLYTALPKRPWAGLTHQQTKECVIAWDGNDAYYLCRAIEAKLKEKNT